MLMGLVASESGLEQVNQVRDKLGYGKTSVKLQEEEFVSRSTLARFWRRDIINDDNFRSICYIFRFTDEQIDNEIIDWENSTTIRKITNLENQSPPFGYKGCITDSKQFFDRKDVFKTLYQYLQLGWNCSLVGESEIGKSSILWKLSQEGYKPLNLSKKALIYLDLEFCSSLNVLLKELSKELNIKIENPINGFEIRRKLSNKHFILCLDEMEVLTHFPLDDLRFILSLLRALAGGSSANPLTLVTASRSPLSQLFSDSPNQPSPLDNIFYSISIKAFTEENARAFIDYRLEGSKIKFTYEQIDQLIHTSQCHPAKLQQQAYLLYQTLINQ
jgi:hypothetical protein